MGVCVGVGVNHTVVSDSDHMDHSPPGSPVHGILQARILEWDAFPFSRGSSRPRDEIQVALQADSLLSEPPGKSQSDVDDSEKVDDDTEAVTKTSGHYHIPGIALNII